jgi:hypothetical protein
MGFYNSTTQLIVVHHHPVQMRIPPQLDFSALSDFDIEPFDVAPTAISLTGPTVYGTGITVTDPVARVVGYTGTIAIDVTGGWMAFDAEL